MAVLNLKYDEHNKLHRWMRSGIMIVVSLALFVAVWWLIAAWGVFETIPYPQDTFRALVSLIQDGDPVSHLSLWSQVCSSLVTFFKGTLLALVVAIPLGLLLGYVKILRELSAPVIEVLRPIAPVAWAPIFIATVILNNKKAEDAVPSDIPYPYLGLGLFTLLLCVILYFLKLPSINEGEQAAEASGVQKQYKSSVFQYPHVWLGALAIFMYMGLEIGVPSMLSAYFKNEPSLAGLQATDYLMYYWGGMMVGRFIGAGILSKFQPRVLLTACLIGGAACVGISFFLSGMAAVWAMLAAGLFHSVMWPLVFNLGLQELGPHTKAASGIINLGVIGAATLTPIMGWVADEPSLGVGMAICMMFIYYLYVMWFCWKGSKIGLKA